MGPPLVPVLDLPPFCPAAAWWVGVVPAQGHFSYPVPPQGCPPLGSQSALSLACAFVSVEQPWRRVDSSRAVLLVTTSWGSQGAGLSLSSPLIYSAAWSLLCKTSFSSSVSTTPSSNLPSSPLIDQVFISILAAQFQWLVCSVQGRVGLATGWQP